VIGIGLHDRLIVAPESCIQRNPTKGIESCSLDFADHHNQDVAFKEIPQRELRDLIYFIPLIASNSSSCIQRNPTKGIERGFMRSVVLPF
jgi:hypothetical protein